MTQFNVGDIVTHYGHDGVTRHLRIIAKNRHYHRTEHAMFCAARVFPRDGVWRDGVETIYGYHSDVTSVVVKAAAS